MEKPLVFTFLSEINADRRRNAAVLDAEVVAVFVAARVDEPQKLGHQSNANVRQNDGRQIVLKESGNVTKCRL